MGHGVGCACRGCTHLDRLYLRVDGRPLRDTQWRRTHRGSSSELGVRGALTDSYGGWMFCTSFFPSRSPRKPASIRGLSCIGILCLGRQIGLRYQPAVLTSLRGTAAMPNPSDERRAEPLEQPTRDDLVAKPSPRGSAYSAHSLTATARSCYPASRSTCCPWASSSCADTRRRADTASPPPGARPAPASPVMIPEASPPPSMGATVRSKRRLRPSTGASAANSASNVALPSMTSGSLYALAIYASDCSEASSRTR
jgi:hypothetical protein